MLNPARLKALIGLLFVAVVAACTPGNSIPEVTITSPTTGTTVTFGTSVVLSATATDTEDGDLTSDISWASNLDGALMPGVGGDVILSMGSHTLSASVVDSRGATGSASVSVTVTPNLATHVVAIGTSLRLVGVGDDEIVEYATASIESDSLPMGLGIFGIVAHPTQPWLYTASLIDQDWGGARIDRFVVIGDSITHDGAAFLYAGDIPGMECLDGSDGCAPIGLAFSSDGSRFYVDDDDLDGVQVFSVDAAGDLTFISEGAYTEVHGLTIDPTDTYLYNGTNVIEVTGDVPVSLTAGDGGNSTTVVDLNGTPGLITTQYTESIGIYDLTDPEVPVEVDLLVIAANEVRDLGFVPSLERIIAVGRDVVHSVSFDGATLSLDDTYTAAKGFTTQYRGGALAVDGTYALAGWFASGAIPGGLDLFAVAADGSLALLDSDEYDSSVRVVFELVGAN